VAWFQCFKLESEGEVGAAEFQNLFPPRSPPPLIDPGKCCLAPPPLSLERVMVFSHASG